MPIINLELKTSGVRGRIQLILCEMGTKVKVRACRDDITLNITKIQIDKYYRE